MEKEIKSFEKDFDIMIAVKNEDGTFKVKAIGIIDKKEYEITINRAVIHIDMLTDWEKHPCA